MAETGLFQAKWTAEIETDGYAPLVMPLVIRGGPPAKMYILFLKKLATTIPPIMAPLAKKEGWVDFP